MRPNEARGLVSGLVIGVLIAASVFLALSYMRSRGTPDLVKAPPDAAPPQELSPAGDSPLAVALTDEEQRSIGIETVEVGRETLRAEITSPGKVAEAETGVALISARIGGRVERLLLNATGSVVRRGQPVAEIYSPEVFTAAEEYRLSLENRQRLSASREAEAVSNADELIRASRRRLELRGLTKQQVEEIESSGAETVRITVYSDVSGIVTNRAVTEGQYIKEGDALFTVSDLSTVWIEADIFESNIPFIRTGQTARITAPSLTGTLRGTINFLQPSVDPQTRTMVARIQVANPQMRLRPGMFVQVAIDTPTGTNVLTVPRSAVLETGQGKVVYVAKENGVFEKRPIEASPSGESYAVTGGLDVGDRVVTHGNFLLDSQTRLTGTITGMYGGSKAFGSGASAQSPAAGYVVTLRSGPTAPKGGDEGTFQVTVMGPDGKPVPDAEVQVQLLMPAMPSMGMGEMRSSYKLPWNGSEYVGKGTIAMAGPWNVTVEARRGGELLGTARTRFDAK